MSNVDCLNAFKKKFENQSPGIKLEYMTLPEHCWELGGTLAERRRR